MGQEETFTLRGVIDNLRGNVEKDLGSRQKAKWPLQWVGASGQHQHSGRHHSVPCVPNNSQERRDFKCTLIACLLPPKHINSFIERDKVPSLEVQRPSEMWYGPFWRYSLDYFKRRVDIEVAYVTPPYVHRMPNY